VERKKTNAKPDPQPACPLSYGRSHQGNGGHYAQGGLEMDLAQPDRVEAQVFGQLGLVQGLFVPLCRRLVTVAWNLKK
jgi:hypothetical protein